MNECMEVLTHFSEVGKATGVEPFGNGHINTTYLVTTETGCRLVLQRINTNIFPEVAALMENVAAVTAHIRAKTQRDGKDAARCTLHTRKTDDGALFCRMPDGGCWRVYDYVVDTVSHDKVDSPAAFEACGEAFGYFQQQLADFPAAQLHTVIPNFHNTPLRYETFLRSVERDAAGRASTVQREIEFLCERAEFMQTLERAHAEGRLPLRVTHNDTKLNNILFDAASGLPVCVIDLDTVMPGYSVNDFGDSIRFGANTAAEDERDLSRVSLDLNLYHHYARGFLRGFGDALTPEERALLPIGARMMTLECGMRFLTDHLDGDVYFRIHREGHNLDRARCQLALLADMERKVDEMRV
ncbi:MAG: aminoglycoside phosphotransferase family protein [Clostridia bacterium]|nr:aminoglycoside phosphotransferase family protein [Clostridia bacterium]